MSYLSPKHRLQWWPAECETLLPVGQLLSSNMMYRYSARNVLYPFGYSLSYAAFKFSALKHAVSVELCGTIDISATVGNSAQVAAAEVVQVYLQC